MNPAIQQFFRSETTIDHQAVNDRLSSRAENTRKNYISTAIRSDLRAFGQDTLFGNKSDAAMRRIRRECADGRRIANRQVDGLTWDQVERMAATLEASDTKVGLRDSALVRVMSDGLLRIGEAVAINVEDLHGSTLDIPSSKTDQDGEGATAHLGRETVVVVRRWLLAACVTAGPLFCRVRRGDNPKPGERLSVNGARSIIRGAAKSVGIGGRISGHSLRVGSTVNLVRVGAQAPEVEQAGRWKKGSDMVQSYARHEFAGRNAIARYKYGGV